MAMGDRDKGYKSLSYLTLYSHLFSATPQLKAFVYFVPSPPTSLIILHQYVSRLPWVPAESGLPAVPEYNTRPDHLLPPLSTNEVR